MNSGWMCKSATRAVDEVALKPVLDFAKTLISVDSHTRITCYLNVEMSESSHNNKSSLWWQ